MPDGQKGPLKDQKENVAGGPGEGGDMGKREEKAALCRSPSVPLFLPRDTGPWGGSGI